MTTAYFVDGPEGVKWSIWDFGDEMTVHRGPHVTSDVDARIPPAVVRKMTAGHKWDHVVDAAGAIRVAVLLGSENPNYHKLWRLK